jgi:hypothetical protein
LSFSAVADWRAKKLLGVLGVTSASDYFGRVSLSRRRKVILGQAFDTADGGGMVPGPVVRHPALSAGFGAAGSLGGFKNAGLPWKSNMSNKLLAFASRRVSAGRFHFSSTSFRTEVWSKTSDRTQSGRA